MKKLTFFLIFISIFAGACQVKKKAQKVQPPYSNIITFSTDEKRLCVFIDKDSNVIYQDTIKGDIIMVNRIPDDMVVSTTTHSGNGSQFNAAPTINIPQIYSTCLIWWDKNDKICSRKLNGNESISLSSNDSVKKQEPRMLSTTMSPAHCKIFDKTKKIVYEDRIKGRIIIINRPGKELLYDSYLVWWDSGDSIQTAQFSMGDFISIEQLKR